MTLRQKIKEKRNSESFFWKSLFFIKDTWGNSRREKDKFNKRKKTLVKELDIYRKNPPLKLPQFHEFHVNSAVLKTKQEYMDAIKEVEDLGLIPHNGPTQKTWDSLAALSAILRHTHRNAVILDGGAVFRSRILPWLAAYGYKNLIGINLYFKTKIKVKNILYKYSDLTHTNLKSNFFDAITCISVIEHGVDINLYLKEMSRILKPGGLLITSADYWSLPIDTEGIAAFETTWHIFDKEDMLKIIDIAKKYGLKLNSNIELDAKDKTVEWLKCKYTFIYFVLRKNKIE